MEEEKREEQPQGHHFNNSSSTPTTMSFSDEILSPNMSTNPLSFPFEPVDISSTIFDISDYPNAYSSSFGFMDLLSINDYNPELFDDWLGSDLITTTDAATPVNHPLPPPASSTVPNTPASPNSHNSITSSSNEATDNNKNEQLSGKAEEARNEGGNGDGDGSKRDDKDEDKTENQVKPRKKKQREPKYAFVMKNTKDNLDDGYKWRKYGQKAVKNSPFPRSYYRCTTPGCPIKKRVERSSENFSVVVTTYQGQHNHPARRPARTTFVHGAGSGNGNDGGGDANGSQQFLVPQHYPQYDNLQEAVAMLYNSAPPLTNYMNVNATSSFGNFVQDHENYEASSSGSGLLEDVLMQSQMMMTEERGLN